ncbi:MAG: hypothetical protein QM669_12425 [Siphonobacter sp.]
MTFEEILRAESYISEEHDRLRYRAELAVVFLRGDLNLAIERYGGIDRMPADFKKRFIQRQKIHLDLQAYLSIVDKRDDVRMQRIHYQSGKFCELLRTTTITLEMRKIAQSQDFTIPEELITR